MKKVINTISFTLFIGLCVAHVYLFAMGITLSEEINKYEVEIKKISQDNIELEKTLSSVESLSHAASLAASLDFKQKASPVYLNNLGIALRR